MERLLIRQVKNLRRENPNFTSDKLVEACGLHRSQVSNRMVRHVLNKHGFGYRQARKKGVLSFTDIECRYRFAKKDSQRETERRVDFQSELLLRQGEFLLQKKPWGPGKSPTRPNMEDKEGGSR